MPPEAFPLLISQTEEDILHLKLKLQQSQDALDLLTNEIDMEIAFDSNLKNDAQRKVRRFELMQTKPYSEAVDQVRSYSTELTRTEIKLRSLNNGFTVAKLQFRHQIAQLEVQG